MSARTARGVNPSVARALVRAQRRVRGTLREPPTPAERSAAWLGVPRVLSRMALVAVAWSAANQSLDALGMPSLDPFPFRWLQRAAILASVVALVISARATTARSARARRREEAQREFVAVLLSVATDDEDAARTRTAN